MLIGPILGSVLFQLGGFQLPFYSVGVLLLILAVVNYWVVPAGLEQECFSDMSSNDEKVNKIMQ